MFYFSEIVDSNTISNNFIYILVAFAIFVLLFLIMVIYYKIRIAKLEEYTNYLKKQERDKPDIDDIAQKIKNDIQAESKKPEKFESNQEEDAVISYQELVKKETPEVDANKNIRSFKTPNYRKPVNNSAASLFDMVDEKEDKEKQSGDKAPIATLVSDSKNEEDNKDNRPNNDFLNSLVDLRSNLK